MKLPEPFTYFVDRSLGRRGAVAMGEIFVRNLSRIRRVLRRFEVPLAASLSVGGSLRVLLAAGQWLQPPKELK